jgi:hypothetical protein
VLGAPYLGCREEKPLIGRKAVDHRARPAAQRFLVRIVSDGEAADIGDVLAERQFTVDSLASGVRQRAVLLDVNCSSAFRQG